MSQEFDLEIICCDGIYGRFSISFKLTCFATLQELNSTVSDIVEDILKMHDTTKVRYNDSSVVTDVAVRCSYDFITLNQSLGTILFYSYTLTSKLFLTPIVTLNCGS